MFPAERLQTRQGHQRWMVHQEAVVIAASVTPGTWRRRAMLNAELDAVRQQWPLLTEQDAAIRWSTVSLEFRAPTTTQSYWRTILALRPHLKNYDRVISYVAGLASLYGQQAMSDLTLERYDRAEVLKMMVMMTERWARVRTDFNFSSGGRDADQTYLAPEDVRVQIEERVVEVHYRFIKNDRTGKYGVWKRIRPLVWDEMKVYIESRTGHDELFPQSYQAYYEQIKKTAAPHATRALRRGAAQETAVMGGPADVQMVLAHTNVKTQARYLGRMTGAERHQADHIHAIRTQAPSATSTSTRRLPGTTRSRAPALVMTTTANSDPRPPPPRPGAMLIQEAQRMRAVARRPQAEMDAQAIELEEFMEAMRAVAAKAAASS